MRNRRLLGAGCLLGVFLAGCTWQQLTDSSSPQRYPAPGARRVELVNLSTRTQAVNPCSLSAEQFFTKATELCQSGKLGRLQRLVGRYPDVALEMLRNLDPRQAQTSERQAIAQAYDRLFVVSSEARGWLWTLKDMADRPAIHSGAFNNRVRARGLIEQGRFSLAEKAVAEADSSLPPFLRAEAMRLRGVALLLDDQPAQAADLWRQARSLAESDTGLVSELDLLTSAALRKAGQPADSTTAWGRAVSNAIRLNDPILWERLMELKPPEAAWPTGVGACFRQGVAATRPDEATGLNDSVDACVWRQIAEWRLTRTEASAALLGFSRAEADSNSAAGRGEARIGQARALLAMGQESPAMSVLNAVAQSPESAVACHALAVIGAINLQRGRTDEGLGSLKRAVDNPDNARWPGYSQAQADLALAYLTAGKEDDGLRLLHDAQDAFQREGRIADLSQCLANEASYWRKAGQPDRARLAIQRSEQLDASH